MPLILKASRSYKLSRREPLSAAALNAIGSPDIQPDLSKIDETDIVQVSPDKLKPIRGKKLKDVGLENLPKGKKGDIIYFDPVDSKWKTLVIGGNYNMLSPKGWVDKIAEEDLIEKTQVTQTGYPPQSTEKGMNSDKEFKINLPPGIYISEIVGRTGVSVGADNFVSKIGSEDIDWHGGVYGTATATSVQYTEIDTTTKTGTMYDIRLKSTHKGGVLSIKSKILYLFVVSYKGPNPQGKRLPGGYTSTPGLGLKFRTIRYQDEDPS